MDLKDRLKSARLAKKLTLDEVASKVGVSRQTIHRYESGVINNIPSDNIEKLAKALSTTPAELMGWNDGAVKVTTNMSFDDNSPIHTLTQAYLRHPSLVQDEIIRRLEELDVTFSNKVSKLLQASGDINGFMKETGLSFTTVGKFMQGETVLTSPAEAERIAVYFHTNVVELFFDDINPQQKAPSASDNNEEAPKIGKWGEVLLENSMLIYSDSNTKVEDEVKALVRNPRFEKIVGDTYKEVEEYIEYKDFVRGLAKMVKNHRDDLSKILNKSHSAAVLFLSERIKSQM